MIFPVQQPIQMGPSTLLPMSYLSFILLVLAMGITPALGGPYLPVAETGLPVGANPLTAGVDEDGSFYLLESSGWSRVADATLVERVRSLVHSQAGVTRLYVTADRDAPYSRVLALADAARKAGIEQLDLATNCAGARESLLRNCQE